MAQWEQAIAWCEKSLAAAPELLYARVHLAAANAWAGHDKQAREAVAQLQKVHPGFTVQKYAALILATTRHSSPNARASSKVFARRAYRRARRRRIEPSG
ncbi:MAG TPA: hypothetical protein VMB83_01170 [Roseiarcus sp.]|nr:hypothetical protein [Roseiarcus sp.]